MSIGKSTSRRWRISERPEAILAASQLVRTMSEAPGGRLRLLELGCGEGQVIGALVEAHPSVTAAVGVDYSHQAIVKCRSSYPSISFVEGDFTDQDLLQGLGQFDIILYVNTLHEVFSSTFSPRWVRWMYQWQKSASSRRLPVLRSS